MKKSDLYREWARVLDMCDGAAVNPDVCWKYDGEIANGRPAFNSAPERHEFALSILEDKPVFVGDVIYHKVGSIPYKVIDGGNNDFNNGAWSWNPPKKTFLLNGVELPCPVFCVPKSSLIIRACFDGVNETARFGFDEEYGAREVLDCFATILSGNAQ